jgi:hypothetical protein
VQLLNNQIGAPSTFSDFLVLANVDGAPSVTIADAM